MRGCAANSYRLLAALLTRSATSNHLEGSLAAHAALQHPVRYYGLVSDRADGARRETGTARWRTREFGGIRVRLVDYSPGYRADHWCNKGHILLCLDGELDTELADGRRFRLRPGMSYQVADRAEPHRSSSATGATLFIVD